MEVVVEIRDLAAVTAACCFPRSVRDLSLSLLPDRLYWPCLKTEYYVDTGRETSPQHTVAMLIWRSHLMRRRCRVAEGRYPRLLSSSPGSLRSQFLSHLKTLKIHHLSKYSHFGWLWSKNPSSAPAIQHLHCERLEGFIQFNIKSGIGSRAREWNIWQYFGSGNSRRFFSQAGVTLRERHSLLRPSFLSELSTSRTAPKTARPPPTAPGVNIRSCSIPSRRGVQRYTQMKEGWFWTIQAGFT